MIALGGASALSLAVAVPALAQGGGGQQGQQDMAGQAEGQPAQQAQQDLGAAAQAQPIQPGQQGQQAQAGQMGPTQGMQQAFPMQGGPNLQPSGSTYEVGTLQGTIQQVNLRNSTVTVQALVGGGGVRNVTLRARPETLARLNPGDVVALTYNNYNGVLWLAPSEGPGGAGAVAPQTLWSQYGTYTGPVTGVDRARGLLRVRGRTFLAHPEQLEGIYPGQFLSVGFAQIGNQNWVEGLQAGPLSQGAQGG